MSGWVRFVRETAASYGIPYREALSVASQFWPQVKNEAKYANKPRAKRVSKATMRKQMESMSRARRRGTIVPFKGKRTTFDTEEKAKAAVGKLRSLAKLVGRVKPKLERQKMEEFFSQAERGALSAKKLRTMLKGMPAPRGKYQKF